MISPKVKVVYLFIYFKQTSKQLATILTVMGPDTNRLSTPLLRPAATQYNRVYLSSVQSLSDLLTIILLK